MTVVKQAVERLDNIDESYASVLLRLGIRHSANISFCSDNFKLFTQAMLYIWQYNLKGRALFNCILTQFNFTLVVLLQSISVYK